ncbi:MAG: carboxypeptidase-like regulatory domain-containing protein, partial [Myxococcota bacterium]
MHSSHLRLLFTFGLIGSLAGLGAGGCSESSDDGGTAGSGGFGPDAGADQFNPPPKNGIRIHGAVLDSSAGMGAAMPVSGVEVRASVDRNGDGELSADEIVEASTGFDGGFDVTVEVDQGDTVVVRFRADGSAPAFRTVVAGPKADVELTVSLAKMAELSCSTGRCSIAGNLLSVEGLPEGVQGSAQIFNPVTQPDRFPGGFEESTGKLLISGVFSSVELTDENGDSLTQLSEPATLRMNVPVDTWNIMTDIEPGTDRIEVPLYAFDEALGTWVRDGEGYLEDAEGATIPESDLPAIRDGSYAGTVVARGEVTHFSYWNVDWPVESHGCVGGRVLDADGNPAEGAVVSVRGTTYDGSSTPVTVGPDGRFCVNVMRSEGPGEDVDQDGVTGETQRVSARVTYGGKVFGGGEVDVMVEAATCGEGGCTDLGDVRLTPDNQLQVMVCAVSGTVRDRAGNPVEGASVYAFDEALESEAMTAVCGDYFENCTFLGTTGPDGTYTVSTAMLDGLTVFANIQIQVDADREGVRQGQRFLTECPQGPVDITLDQGYDVVDLWVDVMGEEISWDPNLPAMVLAVADEAEEQPKWQIMGNEGGFTGPVTYGTVPAGAVAVWPSSGAPVPMASGDLVTVMIQGTTPEGYVLYGQGEAY